MQKLRNFIREHRNISIVIGGVLAFALIGCCLVGAFAGEDEEAGSTGAILSLGLIALIGLAAWLSVRYRKRGKQISMLKEENERLKGENERAAREEWLQNIPEVSFRNELEVEVKFIAPLVKFLGYQEEVIELRVPVSVQVGRQSVTGEADWLVGDRGKGAAIVIEAKAPTEPLDEAVQDQARSYAYGLGVETYALTNGQRLRVFRRGIQSDTCILDCDVAELAASWPTTYQAMGAEEAAET